MFVFPDILNLFPSLATATEPEMEITSTLLTETSLPSQQPSPTVLSTIVTLEPTLEPATPTEIILEPTEEPTLAPVIIPSARTYDYVDIDTFHADINKTLVFNNKVTFSSKFGLCWRKANSPSDLKEREGFFRRGDYDWWAFDIGENRAIETPVWSSLHECVAAQTIEAVALNAYVTHLEPQKESTREGEFGLFLESQNGNRREYILWIDKDAKMNLRVLENGSITDDNVISVVGLANLQRDGSFLSEYYKFPIQVFLEINNQGFDTLYLQEQEPPYQAVQAFDIQPSQMLRIDHALRPTMDNIQKIGLTGRGGGTRVLIWPIAFFSITPGP